MIYLIAFGTSAGHREVTPREVVHRMSNEYRSQQSSARYHVGAFGLTEDCCMEGDRAEAERGCPKGG